MAYSTALCPRYERKEAPTYSWRHVPLAIQPHGHPRPLLPHIEETDIICWDYSNKTYNIALLSNKQRTGSLFIMWSKVSLRRNL